MNTCQLCKRTFRSARTLESHTNSFHKKSVKKVKCKVYPKAFSSYGDYFRHRKNDHNLPILPYSNEIDRSNSENNSLKSFTNARKAQRNDPGNDDVDEDQLTIDEFDSTSEKSHNKRFRADNSLDTKNISEYGESTDHRGCLLEIQECNDMVTHYKQKVQQLRNENNALEVEISSLLPANQSEKMQLQDEINNLIKDKQYLAAQLNTITKNNNDLSQGYFPYTEVTKKISNCISIQEISQLRNLFRRNKWDEIIKPKNIAVILRLIVGVHNDAISICNPQTSNITSEQRELIHTLKTSSPGDALNIIRNSQSSIKSLFKILDQSLRMMVNLFNKYGSIDENSDTESSDDDYSGNTDESGDETQDENSDKKSSDDDYNRKIDKSTDESQDETATQEGSPYLITDEVINESMVDMPESGSDTTEDDRNS